MPQNCQLENMPLSTLEWFCVADCGKMEVFCESGVCWPIQVGLCDGVIDCVDGHDETEFTCKSHEAVQSAKHAILNTPLVYKCKENSHRLINTYLSFFSFIWWNRPVSPLGQAAC